MGHQVGALSAWARGSPLVTWKAVGTRLPPGDGGDPWHTAGGTVLRLLDLHMISCAALGPGHTHCLHRLGVDHTSAAPCL